MLRTALPQAGGARYAAATAIDLPFRDGTFDDVFGAFVIPHFKKYDTALFDVMRVLKSGRPDGRDHVGQGRGRFLEAWREVTWEFAEPEVLRDATRRRCRGRSGSPTPNA